VGVLIMTAGMDTKLYEFWEIAQPEIMYYVKRNISADDVEDVMQEIFIVIFAKFERFINSDGKREKTVIDFKRWVYKIAKNEIYNAIKKNKRNDHVGINFFCENISEPVNEIEESNNKIAFEQLISCLNDKDKNLIIQRLIYDLPFKDISEKAGESLAALKMRHHRAIRRLKKNI
jgi:RNA polymerase sigma-70 factor (ECF subfamily)